MRRNACAKNLAIIGAESGIAAGKPSQSPPPAKPTRDRPPAPTSSTNPNNSDSKPGKPKIQLAKIPSTSAKRKLVGGTLGAKEEVDGKEGKRKKGKVKGVLSFDEAEGET